MAKARVTKLLTNEDVQIIEPVPPGASRYDRAGGEDGPDVQIENLLTETGASGRAKVKIFRIDRSSGRIREEWLTDCTPAEYLTGGELMLRDNYGPGDYRIKIYGPDLNNPNYFVVRGAPIVSIGRGLRGAQENETVPTGNITEQIAAALRPMLEQQSRLLETVLMRANGGSDTMTQFKQFAEGMGLLRGAQAPVQTDSVATVTQLLTVIKQLQPEKLPTDSEGNVSGEWLALTKALDVVGNMFAAQQTKPVHVQTGSVPSLPNPATEQLAKNSVEDENMKLQQLMFKSYLAIGRNAAANDPVGENIETYAALVYEQAPDDIITMLENDPQWFEKLCALDSAIGAHQEWFAKLRARVIEMLIEDRNSANLTNSGNSAPNTQDGIVANKQG